MQLRFLLSSCGGRHVSHRMTADLTPRSRLPDGDDGEEQVECRLVFVAGVAEKGEVPSLVEERCGGEKLRPDVFVFQGSIDRASFLLPPSFFVFHPSPSSYGHHLGPLTLIRSHNVNTTPSSAEQQQAWLLTLLLTHITAPSRQLLLI